MRIWATVGFCSQAGFRAEMLIYTTTRRRLKWELLTLYKYLKGGCSQVQVGLFTQVTNNKTRGNRMPQGETILQVVPVEVCIGY